MSVLQTIISPICTDSEVSEPENHVTYFSEVLTSLFLNSVVIIQKAASKTKEK